MGVDDDFSEEEIEYFGFKFPDTLEVLFDLRVVDVLLLPLLPRLVQVLGEFVDLLVLLVVVLLGVGGSLELLALGGLALLGLLLGDFRV